MQPFALLERVFEALKPAVAIHEALKLHDLYLYFTVVLVWLADAVLVFQIA